MQQFVEVKYWGDFDIQKTDSIWIGDGKIPTYPSGASVADYKKMLQSNGFKKLETITVEIDEYC